MVPRRTSRGYVIPPGSIVLYGGDPRDVNQPKFIADAVYKAMLEGYTHYEMAGVPEFKRAIAEYYSKFGATVEDPVKQVIINSGGSTGIFQAFAATINPGDEVILFDPTYSAYPNVIQYFGGKVVKSLMYDDDGGLPRPDIEALKAAITDRTKALLVCNPDNPTGCVFTEGELRAIADLAVEHDFIVVSDEIYQEFIWNDKPHFPIISLPDMADRTIVIMSFSKTYVWTGCRVGCIISGPNLTPYINRVPLSLGLVSGAFQRAGIVALKEGEEFVEYLRNRYRDAVEYCSKRLDEMPSISCYMPEATFYLWPDISATGLGEVDFCSKLMEAENVMVRPGDGYGVKGKGHVRIALVTPMDALVEAMDKIERFVKKL